MKNLLETAYDAMDEKQAADLKIIDFRGQSPFVDYFIIGSARNYRMARSIIENVQVFAPFGTEIGRAHV